MSTVMLDTPVGTFEFERLDVPMEVLDTLSHCGGCDGCVGCGHG